MKYIPQFDASDCGAACLAMVVYHFGSRWSFARIRDVAGTDRRGTNLNGMVIAAEELGFSVKALKSEEKYLENDLPLPFIAHLERSEYGTHFFVVYKIKGDRIWVADPDPTRKKQVRTREDFLQEWSGYAVFLNPTPDFKPTRSTKGRLARFIPLLKPHTATIIQAIIASQVLTSLGILGSFYFRYLVDESSNAG